MVTGMSVVVNCIVSLWVCIFVSDSKQWSCSCRLWSVDTEGYGWGVTHFSKKTTQNVPRAGRVFRQLILVEKLGRKIYIRKMGLGTKNERAFMRESASQQNRNRSLSNACTHTYLY